MDSELPPPAYSEADFDQKISTALEISLNISPSQNAEEEEEWEQWDESVYQAAISGSSTSRSPTSSETAGASSSRTLPPPPAKNGKSPSNPPLTRPSEKALSRSSTNSQASKQRPSWYAEAGLDDSSSSSGAGSSSAGPSSPSSYTSASQSQPSSGFIIHNIPDEEEEDRSIPPPPFTAVGPSLDGPPFEEVEVTLSYQADESGPPSPLTSPQLPTALPAAYPTFTATTPQPSSPPQQHRPQPDFSANHHRQSLPVPPLAVPHRVSPRPTTTYGPIHTQSSGVPQVGFNASVAYNKRGGIPEQHTTQQPVQVIDAAAFYNSAVSAYLVPKPVTQRPYTSSFSGQRPQSSYNPRHSTISSVDYSTSNDGYMSRSAMQGNWTPSPVSPRPTYPAVPPPPSISPTTSNSSHYPQYSSYGNNQAANASGQGRWASSEQQLQFM